MRNILKINDSTTVQLVKSGSFRYVQQVCEEGVGIRFENVFSSYIEAEAFYMSGAVTEVSEGDVLYYYQVRDVDDSFTPLGYEQQFLIGVFTVEKCIRGRDTYTFVAYDNIHKLNTDFSAKLLSMKSSFPMTLQDFCDEFRSFVNNLGVTIYMNNYWAYVNLQESHQLNYFYANGITALDILSYLVSLTLQQVVCYPSGAIGFRWYTTRAYQQTSAWKNSDQYIIAPTDQTTYTGSYIDPNTGLPTTGTLIPVFYKENGLSREGFSLANIDGWHLYGIDGNMIYGIEEEVPCINAYNITDNIIASKLEMLDDWDVAWDEIADHGVMQLYSYVLHDFSITPFEVHLFPFRCPFMAGQIIPHIIDADGNQFQSVVMKMEWTDSEVVLTCVAPEYYYQSSSKNFDADDVTTSLSVAVNDLANNINDLKSGKVSKAGDTMTGALTLNTPLAIASGGTGASSAADGSFNLQTKPWKSTSAINSTTPRTLSFSGSSGIVYFAFTGGNSANNMGAYIIYSGGASATPVIKTVAAASNLTLTAATGKITITSSSSANCYMYLVCMSANAYNNLTLS